MQSGVTFKQSRVLRFNFLVEIASICSALNARLPSAGLLCLYNRWLLPSIFADSNIKQI